ncbi:MAG: ABC transporter ATP-binding protein [Lentimicrobiaceae bacterium]|nr:ABC transporter ATP-binding protein [Lentimicrobiaceae bacterium]
MIFQLLSGICSVVGFPMLIPILEYLKTDSSNNVSQVNMNILGKLCNYFGIEPSFYVLLALASILIIIGQALVFVSVIIVQYAGLEVSGNYKRKLFQAYLNVNWLWLNDDKLGEMNHSIIKETDLASVAHLNALRIMIYSIQAIVFLFVSIKLSLYVTLLAFLAYGVLFFFCSKNSHNVQWLSNQFNKTSQSLSCATAELLQNKKFFKSSNVHMGFMNKILGYVTETIRLMRLINLREELQKTATFLFTFSFLICLLMFHGVLGIGFSTLLVLLLVFQRMSPQFSLVFDNYLALNKHIPIYQSVVNRLEALKVNEEKHGGEIFRFEETIKSENVSFAYKGKNYVVENINIEIKPCNTVAFIGSSGAGKSTILDIILGLLKPDTGSVYYGDINHDKLDIIDFRRNVAYVSQNITLLDGTLRENLIIGCPQASDQLVEKICKKMHMDKMIKGLSDGIQTEIGENGVKLSGGQRQRIALARALFMRPKILILDEATSDLDAETEMLLQEVLQELRQSMTIIMVAHRLSTVKHADKIFVIEDGTVCEAGTYDELIKKEGRLHYLDSLQSGTSTISTPL